MPPCASMRCFTKRRRLASRARGGDPVARASDYPVDVGVPPDVVDRSLRDAATPWQSLRVRWYDGACDAQISGTALWYRSGQPVLRSGGFWYVPVKHPPRAFFSTCGPGEVRARCCLISPGVFHQLLEALGRHVDGCLVVVDDLRRDARAPPHWAIGQSRRPTSPQSVVGLVSKPVAIEGGPRRRPRAC